MPGRCGARRIHGRPPPRPMRRTPSSNAGSPPRSRPDRWRSGTRSRRMRRPRARRYPHAPREPGGPAARPTRPAATKDRRRGGSASRTAPSRCRRRRAALRSRRWCLGRCHRAGGSRSRNANSSSGLTANGKFAVIRSKAPSWPTGSKRSPTRRSSSIPFIAALSAARSVAREFRSVATRSRHDPPSGARARPFPCRGRGRDRRAVSV